MTLEGKEGVEGPLAGDWGCEYCGDCFDTCEKLVSHIKSAHPGQAYPSCPEPPEPEPPPPPPPPPPPEEDVGTSLSISSPSSVPPGEFFNISGILTRDDTGAPIPYANILLYYDGTLIGSVTTGVDGDYLKTLSIGVAATYTLKASYTG